ncbi:unnamed protein product [Oikopleura dioica]|uniref:Uncharacterized protein n=1 Tax=Oikopleura dioica TaxID=34765 RepID=E4XH57_OIKDI|nr:unnamed protein product [Oikopleura dioica]
MPVFQIKLKMLKEMYHIELNSEEHPLKFREAIEAATCMAVSSQRIKCKGKLVPADLENWDDYKEILVDGLLMMIMM